MSYYVRLMLGEDVVQVTEIDREAFPTMWPPVKYHDELRNPLAHYIVAPDEDKTVGEPEVKVTRREGLPWLLSRIRQLFNNKRSLGNKALSLNRQYIVGFAGFWIMADEAHIISLAVRESLFRHGIGGLLLIAIMELATRLKCHSVTLEVRVSNTAAISLYQKYGFTQVGLRRGYYLDNKEDAVLMSTENSTSASFQAHLQQLKEAHARKWKIPLYQISQLNSVSSTRPEHQ